MDGIEIAKADDLGTPICRIKAMDYIQDYAIDWKRKSIVVAIRKSRQGTYVLARIDLRSGDIEAIAGGHAFESGLSAWDGSIGYVAKKADGSCEAVIDGTTVAPFACQATTALAPAEIILSSAKHVEVRNRAAPYEMIESFFSPNIRLNLSPDGKTLAWYNPAATAVEVAGLQDLHAVEVPWKAEGLVERRIKPMWNWDGSLTVTRGFRPYLAECSDFCSEYIRVDPTLRSRQKGVVMRREAIGTGFIVDFIPTCPTKALP